MMNQLARILINPAGVPSKAIQHCRSQWLTCQINRIQTIQQTAELTTLDFVTFKEWSETAIDVYKILQVFELVPSPWREHDIILQILDSYQKNHGDSIYVLSYRWWDTWKEYTENNQATQEYQSYVGKVRDQIAQDSEMSDELKKYLFDDDLDSERTSAIEKTEWFGQMKDTIQSSGQAEVPSDVIAQSFTMRQQLALGSRRSSSQLKMLAPTPRKNFNFKLTSQVSLPQAQDSQSHVWEETETEQVLMETPLKISTGQINNAKMRTIEQDGPQQVNLNKGLPAPRVHKIAQKPNLLIHNARQAKERHSGSVQSIDELSENEELDGKDLLLQMKDSSISETRNKGHSPIKKKVGTVEKLKLLVNTSQQHLTYMTQNSTTSLMHLDELKHQPLTTNFNGRPLQIDNSDIEGEHPGQLQPNLIMYRDFVTIPEKAWKIFCSWYGVSQQSPVFARKILLHNSVAQMELYPPRILCALADREGKPIVDSQKPLFVSTTLAINEVHLKICELFNYISTRDTRLWVKGSTENNNEWCLVDAATHTVKDGDVYMVEVKFYGNQWPMEIKTGQTRGWRQFEIGDRVDVMSDNKWKVGVIDKVNKDCLKIHLVNENYKNDLTIKKDSELLAYFGQHTMSLHFKNSSDASNLKLANSKIHGIRNIGNTCYMNSVLQILLHSPLFSNYFFTPSFKALMQPKKDPESLVCEAFNQLVQRMRFHDSSMIGAVDPSDFKKVVNTLMPLFYGNQQQDAAEFFNFLMDKLNEEMKRESKKGVQTPRGQTMSPRRLHSSSRSAPNDSDSQKKEAETGECGGTSEKVQLMPPLMAEPNSDQKPAALLEERKKVEVDKEEKVRLQQRAICEAKQTVYNEFFMKPLSLDKNTSVKHSQQSLALNPSVEQMTDSFNPNITDVEAKARSAWFASLQQNDSAVSDLFVGQQTTEVTCLRCKNKTYQFENFYSLPVPLPIKLKTTFYIHVVRWQKNIRSLTPIVVYGVQMNKNLKLSDLMLEVKKIIKFNDQQFFPCEIAQSKIYRVHEDMQTPLYGIAKRTNQLYLFEQYTDLTTAPSTKPRLQRGSSLQSNFVRFDELQPGMLIDAQDQYQKWYVALVIDKEPANDVQPAKICVHFYQLHQRFEEWITEGADQQTRVKPLGMSGLAEQPKDMMVRMILLHRKGAHQGESSSFVGLPYCIVIPNWITWRTFAKQISLQVLKHINQHSDVFDDSEKTDMKELQISRPQHVRTTQQMAQSPNNLFFKSLRTSQHSPKRLLEPIQQKTNIASTRHALPESQDQIPNNLEDYFTIKIFDSETHQCAFCVLKQRCRLQKEVCKNGCEIPINDELVKYTLNMMKNLEIVIDWAEARGGYYEAKVTQDISYLRFKKLEEEVISGVPLGSCLDLYSRKEKLEGYSCDTCKSLQNATLKPMISHLPDILVLHLKRFNFESGYLDKIEDLVTYPLRNLEMSKYLIQGARTNSNYDLYGIVNHHIYQTGGHYTAILQSAQGGKDEEPIWVQTNDSKVVHLAEANASDLVKKDAYMLFYKRRELTPSTILKLTHQV